MKFKIYTFILSSLFIILCASNCKVSKQKVESNASGSIAKEEIKQEETKEINPKVPLANLLALEGTWVFQNFTSINTDLKILFPERVPQFTLEVKNGRFSGFAGCNNINGKLIVDRSTISFAQPFSGTKMSCNAMGEGKFIEMLRNIKYYQIIDKNTLQLLSGTKPDMVFQRLTK